ncbi:MAG: type II secretion system F family protein [Nanoarchaeota archaeon]
MDIEKKHILGIIAAVVISASAVIFLRDNNIFYFVLGLSAVVAVLPFIVSIALESRTEKENNEMFLEFSRNLAEAVKSGTPISRSIMNVRNKYYGPLTPHIQKLANQIALGIPVKDSLNTFASDVNSKTVTRAVNLISEAEKAGGKIEDILDSVSKSVAEIEKLKKERRSAISSLVVQGYIIFFIFIIIMLVLQFKILPMVTEFGGMSGGDLEGLASAGLSSGNAISVEEMARPFLYLLLTQGFFAGLIIGKLSEGQIKPGLKHSFIMMIVAYLVTTGVRVFM